MNLNNWCVSSAVDGGKFWNVVYAVQSEENLVASRLQSLAAGKKLPNHGQFEQRRRAKVGRVIEM